MVLPVYNISGATILLAHASQHCQQKGGAKLSMSYVLRVISVQQEAFTQRGQQPCHMNKGSRSGGRVTGVDVQDRVPGLGGVRESADSHLRLVSGGRGRTDEAVWLMDCSHHCTKHSKHTALLGSLRNSIRLKELLDTDFASST